jgi:hypothetical protein
MKNVKCGDLMSFTYYAKVENVKKDELCCRDVDSQDEFKVIGDVLIKKAASADLFDSMKKVTKTEAAELLVKAYNKPFTVVFDKQDGEERTLRGRLVEPEPLLGRSMVEDLDLTTGSRLRQVDHRTIKSLTLDNIRYEVKK